MENKHKYYCRENTGKTALTADDKVWIDNKLTTSYQNETNTVVNSNENGTYQRKDNFKLSLIQTEVLQKLKTCNYKTPPLIVKDLLNKFFSDPDTKDGHWLFIAQNYPPRRILLCLNQMVKEQTEGWKSIDSPAAYFTFLMKYRKKRKVNSHH